jgi:hypothetical protein
MRNNELLLVFFLLSTQSDRSYKGSILQTSVVDKDAAEATAVGNRFQIFARIVKSCASRHYGLRPFFMAVIFMHQSLGVHDGLDEGC